jgi:hypothetical protein
MPYIFYIFALVIRFRRLLGTRRRRNWALASAGLIRAAAGWVVGGSFIELAVKR